MSRKIALKKSGSASVHVMVSGRMVIDCSLALLWYQVLPGPPCSCRAVGFQVMLQWYSYWRHHCFCFKYIAEGSDECYWGVDGQDYTGQVNHTIDGQQCQRWDRQYPHQHTRNHAGYFPETSISDAENYCR